MNIDWSIVAAGIIILFFVLGVVLYLRRPRRNIDYYVRLSNRGAQAHAQGNLNKARKQYVTVAKGIQRLRLPDAALIDMWGKALLALGQIERQSGRVQEAMEWHRKVVYLVAAPVSSTPEGPISLPQERLPLEILQSVVTDYAAHEMLTPDAVNAFILYLRTTSNRTDKDPVITFLKKACEIGDMQDRDRLNTIIELAQRIVAVEPNLAWAYLGLGLAQHQVGHTAEAITALHIAEQLDPLQASAPFHLGLLYLSQNKSVEAQGALRRSLKIDPEQSEALYQLARLLMQAAESDADTSYVEATQLLAKACDLNPQRADIWYLRSQTEVHCKNPETARMALERAVALDPNNTTYLSDLVAVLLVLRDEQSAILILRQILEIDSSQCTSRQQLADLLLTRAEATIPAALGITKPEPQDKTAFVEAEQHYRLVLSQVADAGKDMARTGLGRALYGQARYGEAIQVLREVVDPPHEGLYALGRAYGRSGMVNEAIRTYEAYIQRYAPNPEILFYLGASYAQQGEWTRSCKLFERAENTAFEEGLSEARFPFYRAVALLAIDELDEAKHALDRSTDLAPDNVEISYVSALLALAQHNHKAAREAFERCLTLDQKYAPAHFGLGLLHEHSGDFLEASKAYSLGLRLNPNWRPAQIRLGVMYAYRKNWTAALETLQPLVQQGQFNPELLFHLGITQANLKRYEAALTTWEPLRMHWPDDELLASNRIAALYELGREHMERGDFDKAINLWEQGLQERPDLVELQDCLTEALVRAGITFLSHKSQSVLGEDDYHQVCRYLERALALQPQETRARYYLGFAALRRGNTSIAIEYLVPLVKEDPDDHQASYHLMLAFLANAEIPRALSLLKNLEAVAEQYNPGLSLANGNVALLQGNWSEAFDQYRSVL